MVQKRNCARKFGRATSLPNMLLAFDKPIKVGEGEVFEDLRHLTFIDSTNNAVSRKPAPNFQ